MIQLLLRHQVVFILRFGFFLERRPKASCFFGSGDHDMAVPFTGSQAWRRSIGYKIVDEWRPWSTNDQVSGYF